MMQRCRTTSGLFFAILLGASAAHAEIEVEAYRGVPFGVGRLTVTGAEAASSEADVETYVLTEANGRALYPAIEYRVLREKLRRLLGARQISRRGRGATVYFLFQGDEPLDLTFFTFTPQTARVVPQTDPRGRQFLLEHWWRHTSGATQRIASSAEYPPIVENYLTATLGRRLGLGAPRSGSPLLSRLAGSLANPFSTSSNTLDDSVGLVVGTESIQATLQKERLAGSTRFSGQANLPLPSAPRDRTLLYSRLSENVDIEPLAMHVPAECFYIRFGSFTNYVWIRDFMNRWGGDVRNMIARRGVNYRLSERIEQQLSLQQSSLARVLGPAVISDLALVGTDLFVREGASIGMLFEARNNLLLSQDILSQRRTALAQHSDAKEEIIQIAGHEVSLVVTPDNRVRSFYAADGDYHLVTTSKNLVRRFYEAGAGKKALGKSEGFRYARTRIPMEREDTAFVYFSDPFFRQFISPHYRIEMSRRLVAMGDIDALELARLAAKAEKKEAHSIVELIDADFLPRGFADRADRGQPIDSGGQIIDSLRGAPGAFLPIADVELTGATATELRDYDRFLSSYLGKWNSVGPLMVGLQRTELPDARGERLHLELAVSPFAGERFSTLATWLGRPTRLTVAPVPGNVASLDVVLGKTLGPSSGPVDDYHVLAGMRDSRPPWTVQGGKVVPEGRPFRIIRAYLGAWPFTGLLAILFSQPDEPIPTDADGNASLPSGGVFMRKSNRFTIFSMKTDVLNEVAHHLEMRDADRPAQARIHLGDMTGLNLAEAINAFGYMRARQASMSVSRLMNSLSRQLGVAPEECQDVAKRLLRADLSCALGGQYSLVEHPGELRLWTSDALPKENRLSLSQVPEDYQFPLLGWFRGLDAELALTEDELSLRATIDIKQDAEKNRGFQLPDILGLGTK